MCREVPYNVLSRVSIRVEKVIIVLRDGRKLIGVLRSYDQYGKHSVNLFPSLRSKRLIILRTSHFLCVIANLVLEAAIERIYHGLLYAEIPRGLYLIRGENVVLLGEVVSNGEA